MYKHDEHDKVTKNFYINVYDDILQEKYTLI